VTGSATTERATAQTALVGLIAGVLGAIGLIDGGGGGTWTDVLASFGLSESTLGPAFAAQAAFVFPVLLFGGFLLARIGLRAMLVIGSVLLAGTSFGMTSLEGLALFILLFVVRGAGLALLDLSGNVMAMQVERETGRHIMGIVHAGFSAGVVAGSLIAFVIYLAGGSFRAIHGLLGGLLVLVAVVGLFGRLPAIGRESMDQGISIRAYRSPLVRICGIGLGLAFGAEVVISQFVSVLLRSRIEASEATGVLAVVIYATMMALGRLANGPLLNRFDPINLLIGQGAVLAAGGLVITASTNVATTLLGSFMGGLGVAGVVPTVLSYAAAHTRTSPGETAGASLLGGYLGALVLPLAAGALTSVFTIRAGIALVSLAGALTIWCAVLLRGDERSANRVTRRLAGLIAPGSDAPAPSAESPSEG
jgi:MFS family permease